ncbi:MAG TPA: hypothetical protein H9671_05360 [Firmicutes bacterium]|nr:hypothetical protein [Bacillota bacterium]
MEGIESYRIQEVKRLLTWITENCDLWRRICYVGEEPKWEEIKTTIKELARNSFYDVIILYMGMYGGDYKFDLAMDICNIKYIVQTWNEDNARKLLNNILFELDNFQTKNLKNEVA